MIDQEFCGAANREGVVPRLEESQQEQLVVGIQELGGLSAVFGDADLESTIGSGGGSPGDAGHLCAGEGESTGKLDSAV